MKHYERRSTTALISFLDRLMLRRLAEGQIDAANYIHVSINIIQLQMKKAPFHPLLWCQIVKKGSSITFAFNNNVERYTYVSEVVREVEQNFNYLNN